MQLRVLTPFAASLGSRVAPAAMGLPHGRSTPSQVSGITAGRRWGRLLALPQTTKNGSVVSAIPLQRQLSSAKAERKAKAGGWGGWYPHVTRHCAAFSEINDRKSRGGEGSAGSPVSSLKFRRK